MRALLVLALVGSQVASVSEANRASWYMISADRSEIVVDEKVEFNCLAAE